MKSPISFIIIILTAFSFFSCSTDVPIGYDSKLPDNRFVGMWWDSNPIAETDEVYEIKNLNGSATLGRYKYNKKTSRFETDNKLIFPLFKSFVDQAGEPVYFVSVKDKDVYRTVRYSFQSNTQLKIGMLLISSVPGDYQKVNDDLFKFGTTNKFQRYVEANLSDPKLAPESGILQKISSLSALEAKLREDYKNKVAKPKPQVATTPQKAPAAVNNGVPKPQASLLSFEEIDRMIKTWESNPKDIIKIYDELKEKGFEPEVKSMLEKKLFKYFRYNKSTKNVDETINFYGESPFFVNYVTDNISQHNSIKKQMINRYKLKYSHQSNSDNTVYISMATKHKAMFMTKKTNNVLEYHCLIYQLKYDE